MSSVAAELLALEDERCRAIVAQDWMRLRELLSPALVHTHTRGNVDGRDSYLRYAAETIEILDLRREALRVIPAGRDAAVMHGKQINLARLRGQTEALSVEAMVTQVWARDDGASPWRLVAFHATPLGAPPPAITRR